MTIYFLIPVILFIMTLQNSQNKWIERVTFLFVGIFLCTSYFNGSDWRQYEPMYYSANWNFIRDFYAEKGFYIYMLVFKTLGFQFFQFFIITKFIVYYIFYIKICEYNCNKYFVLNAFYAFIGLYLFIDCPFRNLIGISIIYMALSKLEKNKNIQFIILVLIAGTFHQSLLLLILLVFLKRYIKVINSMSSEKIIFVLLAIWIGLMFQEVLFWILFKMPLFAKRLSFYLGTEYSVVKLFSFGNIEKISFILAIITLKEKIFVEKKDWFLFGYILLYFIFYRVALTFPILSRYVFCFQIFYFIGISKLFEILEKKLKVLMLIFFIIYEFFMTYRTIWYTYKYLPYVSYIKYLGEEKPSFEHRSEYNVLNYFIRFGNDMILK
ncbi:EpsG family protein [uncultured Fusobacterium sp.]|uniref:EpsG family protein n=1 Tax=uncultured Fusobacterium sp. TaxID=159267 RepID=UPI002597D88B|nr:EpsG family protein [uncultured Fusobacterium sp.]